MFNNGSCPLLEYHWTRLATSSNYLGINLPFDLSELNQMILELISQNELKDTKSAIRLTVTDGIFERGILSNGTQNPTYILTTARLPENSNASMSATIVNTRRNEGSLSSKIKSVSYLDNILARKEAVNKGFDEAFLLNSRMHLAEGAICNIFIVREGTVYTPQIEDGALPGVMRRIILKDLPLSGIKVIERSIDVDFLLNSDEIFISNALLGIKPIHQLDCKAYLPPFSITKLISDSLKDTFNI
ncbi:MAG: aminotransferase class IV [Tatlockia sp.]|nr:aminotransferase class IV [Tatlockia sp.]